MPSPAAAPSPKPSRTIAADFPAGFFLDKFLAVRHDNSLLIAVANRKELYYVPPPRPNGKVEPTFLHIFDALVGGVAESNPMCLWFSPATSTRRTTITPAQT